MFSAQQEFDRIRKITELPRRCLRQFVMAVLMTIFMSNAGAAADDNAALVVSPISAVPSSEVHNGKLVWVDLITPDPRKGANF